jgi:hypothetical protein
MNHDQSLALLPVRVLCGSRNVGFKRGGVQSTQRR